MSGYIKRVFVVLDILLNVLRGGDMETISSACGKSVASSKPCRFCRKLCALIDRLFDGRWKGHCAANIREPYK